MKNKTLKKKLREQSRKNRERNPNSKFEADSPSSDRLRKKRRRPEEQDEQANDDLFGPRD